MHGVNSLDRRNLSEPDREQFLALVGYLALANCFGDVVEGEINLSRDHVPAAALRVVGEIMSVAGGRGHRARSAQRQTVVPDRHRRVKARKAAGRLA